MRNTCWPSPGKCRRADQHSECEKSLTCCPSPGICRPTDRPSIFKASKSCSRAALLPAYADPPSELQKVEVSSQRPTQTIPRYYDDARQRCSPHQWLAPRSRLCCPSPPISKRRRWVRWILGPFGSTGDRGGRHPRRGERDQAKRGGVNIQK